MTARQLRSIPPLDLSTEQESGQKQVYYMVMAAEPWSMADAIVPGRPPERALPAHPNRPSHWMPIFADRAAAELWAEGAEIRRVWLEVW